MRGFSQRRRSVLFDRRKKATELGKQDGEVEGSAQLSYGYAARFQSTRSRDAGAKGFLERGDVFVETEKFRGERVLRGEPLGAADSGVVLGRIRPTGPGCRHLRGVDDSPTISLYQPG